MLRPFCRPPLPSSLSPPFLLPFSSLPPPFLPPSLLPLPPLTPLFMWSRTAAEKNIETSAERGEREGLGWRGVQPFHISLAAIHIIMCSAPTEAIPCWSKGLRHALQLGKPSNSYGKSGKNRKPAKGPAGKTHPTHTLTHTAKDTHTHAWSHPHAYIHEISHSPERRKAKGEKGTKS